jgi:hypothetical protein
MNEPERVMQENRRVFWILPNKWSRCVARTWRCEGFCSIKMTIFLSSGSNIATLSRPKNQLSCKATNSFEGELVREINIYMVDPSISMSASAVPK